MKQSESIKALSAALVKAHGVIQPIAKDGVNPHFKSKFATLDAIMVDVRPILAENGLAIVQGANSPHTTETGTVTAFTVETLLVHESGEWVLSSVVMPIIKADPQGAGAAITYGRRYGVSALLGLSTDEDDDGNAASQKRSGGRTERVGGERRTASVGTPPVHRTDSGATTQSASTSGTIPFGVSRGTKLTAMATDKLSAALQWAKDNSPEKYSQFVEEASVELSQRTA